MLYFVIGVFTGVPLGLIVAALIIADDSSNE